MCVFIIYKLRSIVIQTLKMKMLIKIQWKAPFSIIKIVNEDICYLYFDIFCVDLDLLSDTLSLSGLASITFWDS